MSLTHLYIEKMLWKEETAFSRIQGRHKNQFFHNFHCFQVLHLKASELRRHLDSKCTPSASSSEHGEQHSQHVSPLETIPQDRMGRSRTSILGVKELSPESLQLELYLVRKVELRRINRAGCSWWREGRGGAGHVWVHVCVYEKDRERTWWIAAWGGEQMLKSGQRRWPVAVRLRV